MLGSIYTSMGSMYAFNQAMGTLSQNLQFTNVPGYRSMNYHFADTASFHHGHGYQAQYAQHRGVRYQQQYRNWMQGELRYAQESITERSWAIGGEGLFVLRDQQGLSYTRNGLLSTDAQGYLIQQQTNARLQAINHGQLQDIKIDPPDSIAGSPTASVHVQLDKLYIPVGGGFDTVQDVDKFEMDTFGNLTVYDADGVAQQLTLKLELGIGTMQWQVSVFDKDNKLLNSRQSAEDLYGPINDHTPVNGISFNQVQFRLKSESGEETEITLDFEKNLGSANAIELITSDQLHPADGQPNIGLDNLRSQLTIDQIDGQATRNFSRWQLGENGQIEYFYGSDAEPALFGQQLALAYCDDYQQLIEVAPGFYQNMHAGNLHYSMPNNGVTGRVYAGAIESSNMNVNDAFAKIISLQKAYQSASQVLQVSNELLQTLYGQAGRS